MHIGSSVVTVFGRSGSATLSECEVRSSSVGSDQYTPSDCRRRFSKSNSDTREESNLLCTHEMHTILQNSGHAAHHTIPRAHVHTHNTAEHAMSVLWFV